jgi:hypothetical protein
MAQNLLTFHSITGCDTTSFFYGILKKKTYKVYEQDANLLEGAWQFGFFTATS